MATGQLQGMGMSTTTVDRWESSGYLHLVLPRVYAVGHPHLTPAGRLKAALLYAGDDAALRGASALWWRGIIDTEPLVVDVITPGRHQSVRWVRVASRREFEPQTHKGLPTTTVERALLDFAATHPEDRVRHALANADYHKVLDVEALSAELKRGANGSARLRAALHTHWPELARTRSELERKFVALCRRGALPPPLINHLFEEEGILLDAFWPQFGLVVELDGYDGHRSRAQLRNDHDRDLKVRRHGLATNRYSDFQITYQGDEVLDDLDRSITARRRAA